MSYNRKVRGRGKSGNNYVSRFYQHDDRASQTEQVNDSYHTSNENFQGKMSGYQNNPRRSRGRYRGSRGPNANYRGSFRNNRGRRPYGSRGRRFSSHECGDDSSPFLKDEDGDEIMADDDESSSVRFNPYARPGRKDRFSKHSNQSNSKNESWHRITILNGSLMDEEWLHQEIQSKAMIQFQPYEYHLDGRNSTFFINDRSIAEQIRSCTKQISAQDGSKIVILMKAERFPPFDESQIDKIKEVLRDRFDSHNQHLNLSSIYHEEKLRTNRIRLNQFYHAFIIGRLIANNIPSLVSIDLSSNSLTGCEQLKYMASRTPSVKKLNMKKNQIARFTDMSGIKLWDLTDLTVDQNPLCSKYKNQTEYISDAREVFPNLTTLDSHQLPPPVKFDVESGSLPQSLKNYLSPSGHEVIINFVQEYFKCYDQSRMNLLQAYNEMAMFSLTLPTSPRGPSLLKYFDLNRNLKKIKKGSGEIISKLGSNRDELLKKLNHLPPTEHVFASFAVDVPLVTSTTVNFIIRGLFKETNNDGHLRAFSRSFFCIVTQASLQIINDQYFVRNPTATEIKESKSLPANRSVSSPVNTSSQHSQMIASFSNESGMNLKFSEQCLVEYNWDYSKAGEIFLKLKAEGKIPPEAFVK